MMQLITLKKNFLIPYKTIQKDHCPEKVKNFLDSGPSLISGMIFINI